MIIIIVTLIIVTIVTSYMITLSPPSISTIVFSPVLTHHHMHDTTTTTRYVRIEKIPGGELSDCCVIDGVMFNKGKYEYVHGHGHAYEPLLSSHDSLILINIACPALPSLLTPLPSFHPSVLPSFPYPLSRYPSPLTLPTHTHTSHTRHDIRRRHSLQDAKEDREPQNPAIGLPLG
jgi:hypothetical protein